jgi:hypothetical protein
VQLLETDLDPQLASGPEQQQGPVTRSPTRTSLVRSRQSAEEELCWLKSAVSGTSDAGAADVPDLRGAARPRSRSRNRFVPQPAGPRLPGRPLGRWSWGCSARRIFTPAGRALATSAVAGSWPSLSEPVSFGGRFPARRANWRLSDPGVDGLGKRSSLTHWRPGVPADPPLVACPAGPARHSYASRAMRVVGSGLEPDDRGDRKRGEALVGAGDA